MKKHLLRLGTMCLLLVAAMVSRAESVTAVWDFQNVNPSTLADEAKIEKKTGEVSSTVEGIKLFVDATNGKLSQRASDAQFNTNTIIRVPVQSKKDVVTVVSYPGYHNYTIAGVAAEKDEETYTATSKDVKQGYVEIVGTGSSYLYKIQVVQQIVEVLTADREGLWDFRNMLPEGIKDAHFEGNSGELVSTNPDIKMFVDGTNGKLKARDSDAQFNKGTILRIPVLSAKDIVTVEGYEGYSDYTILGVAYKNTTEHKATSAEVNQGYVEVISGGGYLRSIKVVQKSPFEEKQLYSTNFMDWTKAGAAKEESTVTQNTKYSHETLTFTLFDTAIDPAGTNSKFKSGEPLGWLQAAKSDDPYVQTSKLASVTKVRYVHAATGSNRGWKMWAKGDGDADWVVISETVANPAGWCEVNAEVNRTNVELRWTNLNASQNAYMFELDIYGKVNTASNPALGSLTANANKYEAADIFDENADGTFTATIEVSKKDKMISASNPLVLEVENGEIESVTYETTAEQSVATIKVTADEESAIYKATFVWKPDFTLTYYNGATAVGTQIVEKDAKIENFAYGEKDLTIAEGKKFRGWAVAANGGIKYTTDEVITGNLNLYALITDIEVASPTARYFYNLTRTDFYAEDHEAISFEGGAKYYNDHGWTVGKDDKINLTVGGHAYITLGLCRYGSASTITLSDSKGNEIGTVTAPVSSDGQTVNIEYSGEADVLTLTFSAGIYLHNLTISNDANYELKPNAAGFYVVKANDADNLLSVLALANAQSSSDKRTYIFIPKGIYDLGNAVLTPISGQNISLIGESMDETIIRNHPEAEGIGVTATILNMGKNTYMQDLTLHNAYPYTNTTGRAVCLQDKGERTICKNVKMLSYQDTYYSNSNSQFYWETSEIHGVVDFLCGGGDVFYNKCKLVLESRTGNPKEGDITIAAPYTDASNKYGYVMNECEIENLGKSFNYGRAWGGVARLAYINTTLNQPNEISASRFTPGGMNVAADKFVEFNTMDKDGNVVSPASNIVKFTKDKNVNEMETILTAEQAAEYALDKVFTNWTPAEDTKQIDVQNAHAFTKHTIKWDDDTNAILYAIYKNGELIDFSEVSSYYVADANFNADSYAVRAANKMGGFGAPTAVTGTATGIDKIQNAEGEDIIFNMQGVRVEKAGKGIYIINGKKVVK